MLNSHIGAIAMISFVLTNMIMKNVAGSTSSGLYSPAMFRGSVAKLKVRLYESYLFVFTVVLGRSSPRPGARCARCCAGTMAQRLYCCF